MVTTYYDSKKKILRSTFKGDVMLKEITDYIDATRLNSDFPRQLKILTDSRESNILVKPEELQAIVEANNKSLAVYDFIADAIVLDNPHDTAISYLYGELSKQNNYFFKLFSDYENAEKWLTEFYPKM
jgi:hypothetical protein